MHKLKIKIVVDAECDLYYNIPSPHFSKIDMIKWRLNKIAGRWFRYPSPTSQGLINLIECFKKHNQKATLCIAGHLYLKECKGHPHFYELKPEHDWYKNKIGKDWYYWDNGKTNCLGSIIKKEKDNPLFKFGLHSFTHEALTLERQEVIASIIHAGIKSASQLGIRIESFAAPFEMTEDESDPNKVFDILKKFGIHEVVYAGQDNGLIKKRFFDIKPLVNDDGLDKVWISNYIEGTSSQEHVDQIILDIEANKDKEAIYCLVMHDFTWKGTKQLEKVINYIQDNGFESI